MRVDASAERFDKTMIERVDGRAVHPSSHTRRVDGFPVHAFNNRQRTSQALIVILLISLSSVTG